MKPTKKASEMTVEIIQSVLKPGRKFATEIVIGLCKGTKTKICVVCDFPFGLSTTTCKCMQAEEYCKRGDIFELDIVANYGWIRSGMWEAVETEIRAVGYLS